MQVDGFRKLFTNIALTPEITEMFAKQKSHLRKLGTPIDDFDILIGSQLLLIV
jgi:predicted nucleic acid-binding protein